MRKFRIKKIHHKVVATERGFINVGAEVDGGSIVRGILKVWNENKSNRFVFKEEDLTAYLYGKPIVTLEEIKLCQE